MVNLAFLKNVDWKAFVKGPVFIIIVAALCFYAGRQTAPVDTKVITIDKVTEIHHETQTIQQQVDINAILKKIQESAKSIDKTVIREVITQKDGTKIEKETETSHVDQTKKTTTDSQTKVSELTEVKKILESMRQEEKVKIIEKLTPPNLWTVGAQVGAGVSDVNYIPNLPKRMVVGLSVERRVDLPIVGGTNVGVWATSRLDGGFQLSKSF